MSKKSAKVSKQSAAAIKAWATRRRLAKQAQAKSTARKQAHRTKAA